MLEKYYYNSPLTFESGMSFFVQQCGITYSHAPYFIWRSCSDIYVIEYVTNGEGTVICNGKEYTVRAGDTYLLPVGSDHKYFASKKDPFEKKWINLKGELCAHLIDAYGLKNKVCFSGISIEKYLDQFIQFLQADPDSEDINREGAIIFHKIAQTLSRSQKKKSPTYVEKAKKLIDDNIYKKLSADNIAHEVGLSVSRLGKLFKESYGTTVYSYILQRKIEVSQNLLSDSLLQIGQIADMLGFADEHYFSNVFKSKVGMTPTAYRKNFSNIA